MQLRIFLWITFLLTTVAASSQNLSGVWEGSFFLNRSKKDKMNVRLELMNNGGEVIGVVSIRGFDKNVVYGCDYLVTGLVAGKQTKLIRKNLRRAVSMTQGDCNYFHYLELFTGKPDTTTTISGNWVWAEERWDSFSAKKTEDAISETAKDEISSYIKETYENIEQSNMVLPVDERLNETIAELPADSTELIIDINSVDKDVHDSVTVLINGNPVKERVGLGRQALRIRLQYVEPGFTSIIVVSESVVKRRLKLNIAVKQNEQQKEWMAEPGFVRNVMLLLVQKQE